MIFVYTVYHCGSFFFTVWRKLHLEFDEVGRGRINSGERIIGCFCLSFSLYLSIVVSFLAGKVAVKTRKLKSFNSIRYSVNSIELNQLKWLIMFKDGFRIISFYHNHKRWSDKIFFFYYTKVLIYFKLHFDKNFLFNFLIRVFCKF